MAKFLSRWLSAGLMLLGPAQGIAGATFAIQSSSAFLEHDLQSRDNSGEDVYDQSWVKKWAAVGDSYAAGIGAGNLTNQADARKCGRYDQSYPGQMARDPRLGENAAPLQFLACSGATSKDMLDNQIPKLEYGNDIITVSAGGNDVGLVTILNACVFQWSRNDGCDSVLDDTAASIRNELPGNLDNLLTAIKPKLAKGGKIYVTGYARFWGLESTDCDDVSWAFWYNLINASFLTLAKRKRMNEMVDLVNLIIEAAVLQAGDQVVFVNYDRYFEDTAGRLCEKGVQEPDSERDGLLFYEWQSFDQGENETHLELRRRDQHNLGPGTFGGDMLAMIAQTHKQNPDWEVALPDTHERPERPTNEDIVIPDLEIGNADGDIEAMLAMLEELKGLLIPDGIKRVFHPRPLGHSIIANLVFYKMAVERAKTLSLPIDEEIVFIDWGADGGSCSISAGNQEEFQCNIPDPANRYKGTVDLDSRTFDAMADRFCEADLSKSVSRNITAKDLATKKRWIKPRAPPVSSQAYKGWSVEFSWTPEGRDCSRSCKDAFSELGDTCGGLDSKSMHRKGTAKLSDCGGKYQYEIRPDDPTPVTSTAPSATSPAPEPEKSMLVIWNCPPVTGRPSYDFYVRKAGFEESLDNKCGQLVGNDLVPQHYVEDPKLAWIDKIRPADVPRQAPGRIEHFPGAGDCTYDESELEKAEFTCKSGRNIICEVPSHELKEKITPQDGRCGSGGPSIIRTLVMVCGWTDGKA
ncbi:MAG: hypothetical protein M1817_005803 [Caeruleum heppii]|nr:MAG: hypothetical protein M1817_005803 [Caeruleum heppii]